jgi:hypothetical protein
MRTPLKINATSAPLGRVLLAWSLPARSSKFKACSMRAVSVSEKPLKSDWATPGCLFIEDCFTLK